MIGRRDLVLGGGLLAAAGGALALSPRGNVNLLGGRKLDAMIPDRVGDWRVVPSQGAVLPRREGSLSARLYSQIVNRAYESLRDPPIVMVIAFGDTQSDLLQLHRPEACYSAVGYEIVSSHPTSVALRPDIVIPAREVVAAREGRSEPIIYWTRIGDRLPDSSRAQRIAKLENEWDGFVTDGVLVRLSTVGDPTPALVGTVKRFAMQMVAAMKAADRAVLIGRPLAARIAAG